MTTRREILKASSIVSLGAIAAIRLNARAREDFVSHRPPASKRKFVSRSVEGLLSETKSKIANPELAWMFENCFPNTLDTTVNFRMVESKPDTFVITGDIDAMWLRDSSAQVWPYLPLAKEDADLRRMLEGLIRRQANCILIDPYANAFTPDPTAKPLSWAVKDQTDLKPGVGERKWEIDSLCYPIRLAHGYWKQTGGGSPFDATWVEAMRTVVKTFREQQRKQDPGPYKFQRVSPTSTETAPLGGYGNPTVPVGLIHSMFRPSDDACLYPLFIPANLFAVTSLRQLAEMAQGLVTDKSLASECSEFAQELQAALQKYGHLNRTEDTATGQSAAWAYEVDGFGNQLFMDDANAPGLLSLPYLGCCSVDDLTYQKTRAKVWSKENPYFFEGKAASGIGGPHEGLDMVWPMSIIIRALTSKDDAEIKQCLEWIRTTHAGTGFIHEPFNKDNPAHFTRSWFAWANTLFGELILHLETTSRTC